MCHSKTPQLKRTIHHVHRGASGHLRLSLNKQTNSSYEQAFQFRESCQPLRDASGQIEIQQNSAQTKKPNDGKCRSALKNHRAHNTATNATGKAVALPFSCLACRFCLQVMDVRDTKQRRWYGPTQAHGLQRADRATSTKKKEKNPAVKTSTARTDQSTESMHERSPQFNECTKSREDTYVQYGRHVHQAAHRGWDCSRELEILQATTTGAIKQFEHNRATACKAKLDVHGGDGGIMGQFQDIKDHRRPHEHTCCLEGALSFRVTKGWFQKCP